MLLYAQLIGFGHWVASGIVEEKASRVVEILLAKARPRPLLAGKVLGVGFVGLRPCQRRHGHGDAHTGFTGHALATRSRIPLREALARGGA